MKKPKNLMLVIFGASGDLTKRKLIPALFQLYKQQLMPDKFAILGVGRSKLTDRVFKEKMSESLFEYAGVVSSDKKIVEQFIENLFYCSLNTSSVEEYTKLKLRLDKLNSIYDTGGNFIYYLSTPPSLYGVIPINLAENNLNIISPGWKRLIIEKPFGYDLKSAGELNSEILKYWEEDQIYRIDHYLGKETVQNLLVTRFSNGIFEPLWNRNYIHHIEITSAESIGVEGRGGYYESSGALRDMVQNHLLQVAALIAMEPPASVESNAIRNETMKVFQSLRPLTIENIRKDVIRGQYTSSMMKGEKISGYREEIGVDPNSKTETYAALKFYIDNWRWGGVPFYIRSGKRLPTRVSEVVIHFNPTPHVLFQSQALCDSCNQLVIRIQPDEGILFKFGMKLPGQGFNVQNVNMDFHYSDLPHKHLPTAYERLLYDCMLGDSTLYSRGDAVEAAWKFISPIHEAWESEKNMKIYGYPAGTWGPENADDLIENADMTWRYPCKNLSNDGTYCEL